MRRVHGQVTFWVAENATRYDDGPWNHTYSIVQFGGDKIACETIYITEAWDVPGCRAPWRAQWHDESLD
jgi:hypothetical protein